MKKLLFGFAFMTLVSVMASCGNKVAADAEVVDSVAVDSVEEVADTVVADSVVADEAAVEVAE